MKIFSIIGQTSGLPRNSARRGIALVIVLGFLVLITVLIVAYFTSVTTESSVSKTYANGASAEFLANSAVNIVMGQIAKGTQGQASGGTARLTWASQPGMIRTYDDSGNSDDCYKLYSSPHMVIAGDPGTVKSEMSNDVPTAWSSQPALYTDLNSPVTDSSGRANFPIMDGNNMQRLSVSGSNVLTYHTAAGTTPDIEGFYVQPSYVPNYTTPTATNPLSPTNTPVPMPVQWLYMLKDGTVISPDPSSSGSTATFQNAAALIQSGSNPIVGRIAFWTDDETCKLNVNTASEGTYYAMPHTGGYTDMQANGKSFGFATSPPLPGEYNRYPGHPATTCLSVAMGTWMNTRLDQYTPSAYTTPLNDKYYLSDLANYLTIVPRTGTGGSCAGTVSGTTAGLTAVSNPGNHLYASFDEVMFDPARTPNPATSGPPQAYLTRSELEELKFFLTASSRAPELTPFNTPKVSLWPQFKTSSDRSNVNNYPGGLSANMAAIDLLGFCSSFGPVGINPSSASGKFEYFFEHYSPTSVNSCTDDWTQVTRNQDLANYLCKLGDQNIPGYGAAFRPNKYRDVTFSNIVLESLDYIRSNIATDNYGNIMPLLLSSTMSKPLPGVTASAPIKGFGRFPVFPQIVLGGALTGTGSAGPTSNTVTPFMLFQVFDPSMIYPGLVPSYNVTVKGLNFLGMTQAGGGSVADPYYINNMWEFNSSDKDSPVKVPFWDFNNTFSGYPNYVFPVSSGSTVTLGGGPLTVSFTDSQGTAFQTIKINFPSVTLPCPQRNEGGALVNSGNGGGNYAQMTGGFGLLNGPQNSVARGMECSGTGALSGDWRLLGSMVNVSAASNIYAPCTGYTSNNMQAVNLYVLNGLATPTQPTYPNGGGNPPNNTLGGSLVANTLVSGSDYGNNVAPYASIMSGSGALNYLGRPGDWDTGPGFFSDGPYLNPLEHQTCVGVGSYSDMYYSGGFYTNNLFFTPNRRVASPIQFGSLPTGVSAFSPQPWQTLLFCPNPAARSAKTNPAGTPGSPPVCAPYSTSLANDHLGFMNPPDHLYLEFFTMPVVQPYAISEPLSTAGKVNLNYQIAPFTSIERSTALRGVLKNTLLTGISANDVSLKGTGAGKYKSFPYANEVRYDIDRDKTIAGIEEHYFQNGLLFKYPSEVCDLFLVPKALPGASYLWQAGSPEDPANLTYDNMVSWWNSTTDMAAMSLTGDNLREEPYDRLYPRLTTKSNTYTVHYRVQVLQKKPNSNPNTWVEGQDMVASEYRGSSLIERYVDPNDPKLTGGRANTWDDATINLNFTENAGSNQNAMADLSQLYKFRVISTKKFAP